MEEDQAKIQDGHRSGSWSGRTSEQKRKGNGKVRDLGEDEGLPFLASSVLLIE
jgi:hypothetical protein